MARNGIDADKAFELLRHHSQHTGQKLADVAAAVVDSHLLLLPPSPQPAAEPAAGGRAPSLSASALGPGGQTPGSWFDYGRTRGHVL
jgi:hypothetical protein